MKDTEKEKFTLQKGLKRMFELEKRFEQVHMNRIAEVKETSLQQLFMALSQGDHEHSERLEKIISSL